MNQPSPRPLAPVASAHARKADEVLSALTVGPEGLSAHEAARRLAVSGPNSVSAAPRRSALAAFAAQFNNVLIYVLLAAAVVTTALGHLVDTAVIVGVVVINAIIGFVQERRAERSLEAIRGLIAQKATVVRDGRRLSLPAEDVVPGDVVAIEAGDKVPADLRLIRGRGLEVQESALTGESAPVGKSAEPVAESAGLADRTSMAFAGTIVTRGQGLGVAVATGNATELGRISAMLRAVESPETPLTRQLAAFGRTITWVILVLSAAAVGFGYFVRQMPLADLFLTAVGIAVAAIPEGLPAIVTITLAIGVERMARRNAIVRHLPAVETLGSVGVICSDKTGTFTRNEMTVQVAAVGGAVYEVTGRGYEPRGEVRLGGAPVAAIPPGLRRLAEAASQCNDASLAQSGGEWSVVGDPMEGALLAFATKVASEPAADVRRSRSDEIPFDPERRFMATLHAGGDGRRVVYVKGAPEAVIAMCDRMAGTTSDAAFDQAAWLEQAAAIARQGMRVLALAEASLPEDVSELTLSGVGTGLALIGLAGLMDAPREEAIDAVARCRSAGIRVKMITGDHVGTAAAIAAKLGFDRPANALTGSDIDRLDDSALAAAAIEADVFARTSPEHKLRLVEALQGTGAVVAMTGDGVNDAPALKRADVGVAMGRRGADAAKEAAAIVLADDNFATIAAAVEEGRQVYDNLRKAIAFILPTNAGEAFVLLAAVLIGVASPITPVQILWVNMVTEITLSLAIAFEAAESDLMRRPPRAPSAPILSRFVLWRTAWVALVIVAGVFGVFYWLLAEGADIAYARTAAVNTIVAFEIAYLLTARRFRDPGWTGLFGPAGRPAWIAIALVLLAQLAFTYLPLLNTAFGTVPLGIEAWVAIALVALVLFVASEAEKDVVRRRRARQAAA